MRTNKHNLLFVFLIIVLNFINSISYAVAPKFITDKELAEYPIVVIAKWNKAALRFHNDVEENICKETETHTEIEISRTIKGDIKSGKHKIILARYILWDSNGSELATYTSTMIYGDVNDVTKQNIWFLKREYSWDKSDKNLYLYLDHYRGIQPPDLEKYFIALDFDKAEKLVPKFLKSNNPILVERTLRYICGWIWPWPRDTEPLEKDLNPEKRNKVLKEHTETVRTFIENKSSPLRSQAASVYAFLKGKKCIPYMRVLLSDPDPSVRALAIGVLANYKDKTSIDTMQKAVKGIDNCWLAYNTIESLSKWNEPQIVPTLITFLENDKFALYSKDALHSITGHWFPFNIESSTNAWQKVKNITEFEQRRNLLSRILPCDPNPLKAKLVKEGITTFIEVSNRSQVKITITEYPSWIKDICEGRFYRGHKPKNYKEEKEDFLLLNPGDSTKFKVEIDEAPINCDFNSRKLEIHYSNLGKKFGIEGWIGKVNVNF